MQKGKDKFFDVIGPSSRGFQVKQVSGFDPVKTKSAASRLVNALHRVVREFYFRPKSSGGRARRKGHQFERDIAVALRSIFPKARRHLEYQDAHAIGVDLEATGVFRFQCKKMKGYAPLSAIREIECDRWLGDIPVLVTAADHDEPIAALYWDDFLNLLKASKIHKIP